MFGYVGHYCENAIVYVKSQEDIDVLTALGLGEEYLWLKHATLQVKPSQPAE